MPTTAFGDGAADQRFVMSERAQWKSVPTGVTNAPPMSASYLPNEWLHSMPRRSWCDRDDLIASKVNSRIVEVRRPLVTLRSVRAVSC